MKFSEALGQYMDAYRNLHERVQLGFSESARENNRELVQRLRNAAEVLDSVVPAVEIVEVLKKKASLYDYLLSLASDAGFENISVAISSARWPDKTSK